MVSGGLGDLDLEELSDDVLRTSQGTLALDQGGIDYWNVIDKKEENLASIFQADISATTELFSPSSEFSDSKNEVPYGDMILEEIEETKPRLTSLAVESPPSSTNKSIPQQRVSAPSPDCPAENIRPSPFAQLQRDGMVLLQKLTRPHIPCYAFRISVRCPEEQRMSPEALDGTLGFGSGRRRRDGRLARRFCTRRERLLPMLDRESWADL
mmetsp:Transcript_37679/g.150253  ORF Transcript_37679/g.150253 Transcript_37679/m.150253 type:complete len:211 (-) Transcript_37679:2286-2918(-)